MTAKYPLTINLDEADGVLFDKALKSYQTGKSELGREIIHMWLFNNKIQITSTSNIKS